MPTHAGDLEWRLLAGAIATGTALGQNSVMSPRCYPPEPEFGPGRTAERRVWEALGDQLPDDVALLHSVAMIERAAEHEAGHRVS